jgi:hypothetical protein
MLIFHFFYYYSLDKQDARLSVSTKDLDRLRQCQEKHGVSFGGYVQELRGHTRFFVASAVFLCVCHQHAKVMMMMMMLMQLFYYHRWRCCCLVLFRSSGRLSRAAAVLLFCFYLLTNSLVMSLSFCFVLIF